jgi:ABC-type transporter Mla subunit MlaD
LIGELVARRAAVRRLFASTTALVDVIKSIVSDEPALNETLAALRDFLRMVGEHDALLRNVLQALPVPMRNFANATGSGTAIDMNMPAGTMFDSWMCAISGRATQFNLPEYFKDCK